MFNKTENTHCENCKYYFSEECHRFPPAANGRKWPVVLPKDWCGEFLMKRKVREEDETINTKENFMNGWYLE